MTIPQTSEHWHQLYEQWIRDGVFDQRKAEMQPAWEALAPLIPTAGAFLEVGCGAGLFMQYLIAHGHEPHRFRGVDISDIAVKMAQHAIPQGDFRVCDVGNEPLPWPDAVFDVVFSGHTIEHVPDPVVMLKEMRRVAKAYAAVIIQFPFQDPPYPEHIHEMLDYEKVSEWARSAGLTPKVARPVVKMRPTDDGVLVCKAD